MAEIVFDLETILKLPPNVEQVVRQVSQRLARSNLKIPIRGVEQVRQIQSAVTRTQRAFSLPGQRGVIDDSAVKQYKDVVKAAIAMDKGNRAATTSMEELGRQTAITAKRFTGYILATKTMFALTGAINNAVSAAIEYDRQMLRIAQVTRTSIPEVQGLRKLFNELSAEFGTSALELSKAAETLAQAGKSISEIDTIIRAIAPASLSATFGDIAKGTDSLLSLFSQFRLEAAQTADVIDILNAVSKDFNVSTEELFSGLKRSGSAFAALSGAFEGLPDPTKNLQTFKEFTALFTSVISSSRESAETIGTSLRTIIPRLARPQTRQTLLDVLGIDVVNAQGQLDRPFEAIQKISEAIKKIPSTSPEFVRVLEELGGSRQISRTALLLLQFADASKALNTAERARGETLKDVQLAQQNFAVQLSKIRAEFQKFIDELVQTGTLQNLATIFLESARAAISLANALKPLVPIITTLGGLALLRGAAGFSRKFVANLPPSPTPGYASGGLVPAKLTPGELVIPPNEVSRLGVARLNRANRSGNFGGVGLQNYGIVPGTGNSDSVMSALAPGSFVIKKASARAFLGARGYASGGQIPSVNSSINALGKLIDQNVINDIITAFKALGLTSRGLSEVLNKVVQQSKTAADVMKNVSAAGSSLVQRSKSFNSANALTEIARGGINTRQFIRPDYASFGIRTSLMTLLGGSLVDPRSLRLPKSQALLGAPPIITPAPQYGPVARSAPSYSNKPVQYGPELPLGMMLARDPYIQRLPSSAAGYGFGPDGGPPNNPPPPDPPFYNDGAVTQFRRRQEAERLRALRDSRLAPIRTVGAGLGRAGRFLTNPRTAIAGAIVTAATLNSNNQNVRNIGSVLTGIGSGVALGSAAGPAGAAVGAIVGGLAAIKGVLDESKRVQEENAKATRDLAIANAKNLQEGVEAFKSKEEFKKISGTPNQFSATEGFIARFGGSDATFTGDKTLDSAIGRAGAGARFAAKIQDGLSGLFGNTKNESLVALAKRQAEQDIGIERADKSTAFNQIIALAKGDISKAGPANFDKAVQDAKTKVAGDFPLLALFSKDLKDVSELADPAKAAKLGLQVFEEQVLKSLKPMNELETAMLGLRQALADWDGALDASQAALNRFDFASSEFSRFFNASSGESRVNVAPMRNIFSDLTGVTSGELDRSIRGLDSALGGNTQGRFGLVASGATAGRFLSNDLGRLITQAGGADSGKQLEDFIRSSLPETLSGPALDLIDRQLANTFKDQNNIGLTVGAIQNDPERLKQFVDSLNADEFKRSQEILSKTTDAFNESIKKLEDGFNELNSKILNLDIERLQINKKFDAGLEQSRGILGTNIAPGQALFEAQARSQRDVGQLIGDPNFSVQGVVGRLSQLDSMGTGLSPEQALEQSRLIKALEMVADNTEQLAAIEKESQRLQQKKEGSRNLIEGLAAGDPQAIRNFNNGAADLAEMLQGGILSPERAQNALNVAEQAGAAFGVDQEQIQRLKFQALGPGFLGRVAPGGEDVARGLLNNALGRGGEQDLAGALQEEVARAAAAQMALSDRLGSFIDQQAAMLENERGMIEGGQGGFLQEQLRAVFENLDQSPFVAQVTKLNELVANGDMKISFNATVAPINLVVTAPELANLANSDGLKTAVSGFVADYINSNISTIADQLKNA